MYCTDAQVLTIWISIMLLRLFVHLQCLLCDSDYLDLCDDHLDPCDPHDPQDKRGFCASKSSLADDCFDCFVPLANQIRLAIAEHALGHDALSQDHEF